jgi:hypothetical protein
VIAKIGLRTRVHQSSCESEPFVASYVRASAGDAVKDGQVEAVFRVKDVRGVALKDEL